MSGIVAALIADKPAPHADSMDALVELALQGVDVNVKSVRCFSDTPGPGKPTWSVQVKNRHASVGRNDPSLPVAVASAVAGFKAAQP